LQPVLSFVDPGHGFLLLSPERFSLESSAVLRTDDGGRTWRKTGSAPSLGSVFSTSANQFLWAGAQAQAAGVVLWPLLQKSWDGGATWQDGWLPDDLRHASGGDHFLLAPVKFVGSHGVAAIGNQQEGGPVRFFPSTDAGKSWIPARTLPYGGALGTPAILDADRWSCRASDLACCR
jgi:photosystem II stability/assembly factor-like uncharacterized protein